jgi:hypothetical protein
MSHFEASVAFREVLVQNPPWLQQWLQRDGDITQPFCMVGGLSSSNSGSTVGSTETQAPVVHVMQAGQPRQQEFLQLVVALQALLSLQGGPELQQLQQKLRGLLPVSDTSSCADSDIGTGSSDSSSSSTGGSDSVGSGTTDPVVAYASVLLTVLAAAQLQSIETVHKGGPMLAVAAAVDAVALLMKGSPGYDWLVWQHMVSGVLCARGGGVHR